MTITPELISKFNRAGPRYTSYPTAPEWGPLTEAAYQHHLSKFGQGTGSLSLYIHIPFCAKMCYYCGCNVIIRKPNDQVGDTYLDYLEKELKLISRDFGRKPLLKQLHLGGGTPNFLTSQQLIKLFSLISSYFSFDPSSEIAMEIDPRTIHIDQLETVKKLGVNRISMGIQDFDHDVQVAVNRIQPFTLVSELVTHLRRLDFSSINMDLIYGLPHQNAVSFKKTVADVIALGADRIALYSFAHVPWLKSHQTLINEKALPVSTDKLNIFLGARDQFLENGYTAIGMDHFAKSSDDMAKAFLSGTLYRNFMGYTLKPADEFLGIGVSSIGQMAGGFFQNTKELSAYTAALDAGRYPIVRGLILSEDDKIRQWVIQELMCHFKLEKSVFFDHYGHRFDDYFLEEQPHLDQCVEDGLISSNPHAIVVTDLGKFFIRNVVMGFDWYLRQPKSHQQFSSTV